MDNSCAFPVFIVKIEDKTHKCLNCDSAFSNRSNLRRHVRTHHPDKVDDLAPLIYKNENNYAYSCQECKRNFNQKTAFNRHLRQHNQEASISKPKQASKKCPICSFSTIGIDEILVHFKKKHKITIKQEELEFSSIGEFEEWLGQEEKKTQAKFVRKVTNKCKGRTTKIFVCHRSGFYTPEGNGLRSLKMKGSVKINGYCPAKITLTTYTSGACKIHYFPTHVGHLQDTNLTYLYLTKEEKQNLAAKIAADVPFEDILEEVRNSSKDSELERIHLIRKKDLHNIKQSTSMQQANDDKTELPLNEEQVETAECEEDNDLYERLVKVECIDESEVILEEMANNKSTILLDEEKEIIKNRFCAYLDSIQSLTDLQIVKAVLAPLIPEILAEPSIKTQRLE